MNGNSDESNGKASHLCVLVHGLWGNPGHLDYLASALRERHGKEKIYILAAQRNSGSFTYDGIELGGERVAHEIEETLEQLAAKGYDIKKLSIVGYSLGGLVARYAIGLLEANGTFDKIQPVNFTTFASPHVGVRSSFKGWSNHVWNVLGARSVSASGRQIFLIDNFRGTGKPLLSVMADPDSIFIRGLAKFKNRSVYANIVNDLSTVFYTTAISKVDPFSAPDDVNINYLEGYEKVIVNPDQYILPAKTTQAKAHGLSSWLDKKLKKLKKVTITVGINICLAALLPIAAAVFLLYSGVQHVLSQQRIKHYEQGKTYLLPEKYRVPLMIKDVQAAVENVFENLNAAKGTEYLSDSESKPNGHTFNGSTHDQSTTAEMSSIASPEMSLLALTPEQFNIIDSLNALGIKKYPVHIHKVRHSHAAIIVRMPKPGFSEGKIVVKHWLDVGFEL